MKMKAKLVNEFDVDTLLCGEAQIYEWDNKIVIKDKPLCVMFEKDKGGITLYLNDDQAVYVKITDGKPEVSYTPDSYNIKPKILVGGKE